VTVLAWKPRVAKMEGRATVDGKLACEATVMCALVPRVPEAQSGGAETEPALVGGAVNHE
jgi:3-hydroxyacyl-[acyl-carrier-protein] dehydratase